MGHNFEIGEAKILFRVLSELSELGSKPVGEPYKPWNSRKCGMNGLQIGRKGEKWLSLPWAFGSANCFSKLQ